MYPLKKVVDRLTEHTKLRWARTGVLNRRLSQRSKVFPSAVETTPRR